MKGLMMRWRQSWPEKTPRPKLRRLAADEQNNLLAQMTEEIARSPVLSAFGIQVELRRGRFYVERPVAEGVTAWGRVTPLKDNLLLEVQHRSWKEVAKGSARKIIQTIANDTQDTFHGLGSLEKSLRKAGNGLSRRKVKSKGKTKFAYSESGEPCSVQEALFHFFGLPVATIAEPTAWYSYHRKPQIMEFSGDRTKVLVRFSATSWSGEDFGGTCLYLLNGDEWGAFTIKPSESQSIATAEKWLVKRKWKPWC
jgi:hypothetical protein